MNIVKKSILFFTLLILFSSCQDKVDKTEIPIDTLADLSLSQIDSIDSDNLTSIKDFELPDSLYIEVDEFSRIKKSVKQNSNFRFYINEKLYISDGCYFVNSNKNHYLYVATYTDGYLPTQLLYTKDFLSDSIWNYIEIFQKDASNELSEILTFEEKKKHKERLVSDKFLKIENDSNFVSNYGIFLGMPIEEALSLYPVIDDKKSDKTYDYYYWDFSIDLLAIEGYLDDSYFRVDKFPMAKDTYGSKVIMVSHNNKLCAYIILNTIP